MLSEYSSVQLAPRAARALSAKSGWEYEAIILAEASNAAGEKKGRYEPEAADSLMPPQKSLVKVMFLRVVAKVAPRLRNFADRMHALADRAETIAAAL